MSLDVYLTMEGAQRPAGTGIFIREGGQTKEITRQEWDARYPDREPFVIDPDDGSNEVYSANITHNLGRMAEEAGIYEALWRPGEVGITKAEQLIPLLRDGLTLLKSDPGRFKTFNPSNGWGTYDALRQFVADYLATCEEYPTAEVRVSR